MQIRLLSHHDNRLEVSHVYEESWKIAYHGIVPQLYLDSIPKGRWAEWIDTNEKQTLIQLDDDSIIGTATCAKARLNIMEGYGEIISLYLLPEYWGKGYGKQLMTAAIQNLYQMGYEKILLWVLEENLRARRFYEKYGFQKTDSVLQDNIGGRPLREVQYTWQKR